MRVSQSFRDVISEARRVYGTEGNSAQKIVKRALRSYESKPFEYSEPRDKSCGSPMTLRLETDLTPKQIQGITIAYIQNQIEKSASRRQVPLDLDDSCIEYKVIKEV